MNEAIVSTTLIANYYHFLEHPPWYLRGWPSGEEHQWQSLPCGRKRMWPQGMPKSHTVDCLKCLTLPSRGFSSVWGIEMLWLGLGCVHLLHTVPLP